jgi:hypothetical protein
MRMFSVITAEKELFPLVETFDPFCLRVAWLVSEVIGRAGECIDRCNVTSFVGRNEAGGNREILVVLVRYSFALLKALFCRPRFVFYRQVG